MFYLHTTSCYLINEISTLSTLADMDDELFLSLLRERDSIQKHPFEGLIELSKTFFLINLKINL
jgi:hypothetical protein